VTTKISKTQKKRRASRASGTPKKNPYGPEYQKKHALSGYLVVWRHTMDDVPVGLFGTLTAACHAATSMSRRAAYAAAKKLDIDCGTPICFAVVGFDNGKPTDMLIVDRPDDA
jgi:hypothetical protein